MAVRGQPGTSGSTASVIAKPTQLESERHSAQHLTDAARHQTGAQARRAGCPVGQSLDTETDCLYIPATEIAGATSLPIHLFRDQAERNCTFVPYWMRFVSRRVSLPAILKQELAHCKVGNTAGAATEEAETRQ